MEQIECSETSANINQTPGKHPKENRLVGWLVDLHHFLIICLEDGTDRMFRNVGQYKPDSGETPKRKQVGWLTYITSKSSALKMGQTECSETSVNTNQTPGKHPKENTLNNEHGESLKSRIIL
jgi:hypothetical protein